MDEQRIREIVREELAKEKEATADTVAMHPNEIRKMLRDLTGLSNEDAS